MKSFLRAHLGQQPPGAHSLVGKVIQVSNYSLLCEEQVGTGGYATIYRVRDQPTQNTYALKHLRLPQDSDAVAEVRHEMRVMAQLGHHPNILKLHAASFAGPAGKETDAFMVMDFAPVTLLSMMQRSNFQLDDFFVHEVFSEVCHGIAHMHHYSPPYAHRDIKAENVLKTTKGKWVLCDFGSATPKAQVYETPAEIAMEEDVIRRTTTPAYRAPEMWDLMSRQRIDTKVDIWALGVLLYVLVFGKLPFQGDSKLSILFGKYEMPPGKNPLMCELIRDMLTTDPILRPDIATVISKLDAIKQSLLQQIAGGAPVPMPAPAPPAAQPRPAEAAMSATAQRPPETFDPVFDDMPAPAPVPSGPLTQRNPAQHAQHAQQQHRMPGMGTPPPQQGLQRHSMTAGSGPGIAHPGGPHHAQHGARQHAMPQGVTPQQHGQRGSQAYPNVPGLGAGSGTLTPPPAPWAAQGAAAGSSATPVSHPVGRGPHHTPTSAPPAAAQPSPAAPPPAGAPPVVPGVSRVEAAVTAASAPLLVPSDGALQLNLAAQAAAAAATTVGNGSAPPPPKLDMSTPTRGTQPATAELITVDTPSPLAPAASDAQQSLLGDGIVPTKRHGHHRHKKTSSFSNTEFLGGSSQPDGQAAGFHADWGDAPAFGAPVPSSGRSAPSVSGPQQPVAAASAQQPSKPEPQHRGSDSGSQPAAQRPQPPQSQPPAAAAVRPGLQPGAGPRGPLDPQRSMSGSVETDEVTMLRVQVKGLHHTQVNLAARVKHLEEVVEEQAALIRAMQDALGMEHKGRLSGRLSRGLPSPSNGKRSAPGQAHEWHAFEADSAAL